MKKEIATLESVTAEFLRHKNDDKPGTLRNYRYALNQANDFFKPTSKIDSISPGKADQFKKWLKSEQGLAENTARARCGIVRSLFRFAYRHRLVRENPFSDIKCNLIRDKTKSVFVSREMADKIFEHCPNEQWRILFALARLGGMRHPSETMALRWSDVNWDEETIKITSIKTANHPGHESRIIPIFKELRPCLEAARDTSDPVNPFVVTIGRAKRVGKAVPPHLSKDIPKINEGTTTSCGITHIIRSAGLEPWPKLWNNLRASRETELTEVYPIHVVVAWIGHSRTVAEKNYLQVTQEHMSRAKNG